MLKEISSQDNTSSLISSNSTGNTQRKGDQGLNVINEEEESDLPKSQAIMEFDESPEKEPTTPVKKPSAAERRPSLQSKTFGSLVRTFLLNNTKPNRCPKQLFNVMKKLKGSEIVDLKVSKDC